MDFFKTEIGIIVLMVMIIMAIVIISLVIGLVRLSGIIKDLTFRLGAYDDFNLTKFLIDKRDKEN